MSIAREVHTKHPLPILDLAYRSRQLSFRRKQISQWLDNERQQLKDEVEYRKSQGDAIDEDYLATRVADIEKEAARQEKDAIATYGMLEGVDPRVAPLRRALAVWGLTADDLGVLSIHGTSTGANVSTATCCLMRPTDVSPSVGEERDTHLERRLHQSRPNERQRRTYHGTEEPLWALEGWFRRMATRWFTSKCRVRYHSWKPECRVSSDSWLAVFPLLT